LPFPPLQPGNATFISEPLLTVRSHGEGHSVRAPRKRRHREPLCALIQPVESLLGSNPECAGTVAEQGTKIDARGLALKCRRRDISSAIESQNAEVLIEGPDIAVGRTDGPPIGGGLKESGKFVPFLHGLSKPVDAIPS